MSIAYSIMVGRALTDLLMYAISIRNICAEDMPMGSVSGTAQTPTLVSQSASAVAEANKSKYGNKHHQPSANNTKSIHQVTGS